MKAKSSVYQKIDPKGQMWSDFHRITPTPYNRGSLSCSVLVPFCRPLSGLDNYIWNELGDTLYECNTEFRWDFLASKYCCSHWSWNKNWLVPCNALKYFQELFKSKIPVCLQYSNSCDRLLDILGSQLGLWVNVKPLYDFPILVPVREKLASMVE